MKEWYKNWLLGKHAIPNIQHLVVCVSLVNSCNYMYTT